MLTLVRTTSKARADKAEKKAQAVYGGMAIYRFQYRANDGNFYYEILLNPLWL